MMRADLQYATCSSPNGDRLSAALIQHKSWTNSTIMSSVPYASTRTDSWSRNCSFKSKLQLRAKRLASVLIFSLVALLQKQVLRLIGQGVATNDIQTRIVFRYIGPSKSWVGGGSKTLGDPDRKG